MRNKIYLLIFFIFTVYVAGSFFILPAVLKSSLKNIVAKETYAKLSIDKILFNPFSFKTKIDGVLLKTLDDKRIASFETIYIDLEPHSLIFFTLHIKNITVKKPEIWITQEQNLTFNFNKLIKNKQNDDIADRSKFDFPATLLDSLKVENGAIYYEDLTVEPKFELSANNIDIKIQNIDTKDLYSSDASFRFNTSLSDGAQIDLRGEATSLKPLKLKGTLNFDMFKIYTLWRYFQNKTPLEAADGTLYLGIGYSVNFDDFNESSIDDAHLNLQNLRIKPKDKNNDILTIRELYVENALIKPQDIHIQNIVLDLLKTNIKRDAKGDIEWIKYLKIQKNTQKENKSAKGENYPDVRIEDISIKNAGVLIDDKSENVKTEIDKADLNIKNFTLFGEKEFSYKTDFLINGKSVCAAKGSLNHKTFETQSLFSCKDLDIARFEPYIDRLASSGLKKNNILLKNLSANFDANISLRQNEVNIKSANISLNNFLSVSKENNEKLLNFKNLYIGDINLNTKTKDLFVDKLLISQAEANIKKYKNKALNLESLIETKPEISDEKEYRIKLNSIDIKDSKIDFSDESIEKKAKFLFNKIDIKIKKFDSKEKSPIKYALEARVNKKGVIRSIGEATLTPLEQKGTLELKRVPLKDLTPYIAEYAFLKIKDGYLTLNSKISYNQKEKKTLPSINGSLRVDEFFLHDDRDDSTIASFSKADLRSFSFKPLPASLYMDEAILDSFYVDARIDENKSINLAKLLKPKKEQNKEISIATANEKLEVKLLKLQVSKGSANFADYSLPIYFKTSIHDLNGNIYALSNKKGEVAYVNMRGEVDEYGETKLEGSFEGSNIKSYLDIDFNFRNLNLNSLSGYSAQFAGYKIDEGKLFLDLKYEIKESNLESKNNIIVKNIKLGEEIQDQNITKLPLGFAVALLENSEGVIDIDMPIDGNIDKPDFKYSTIVFKAFSNLIFKAVTSPFTMLGKILGIKEEKLKSIDFETGEFSIMPPEREKLDNIADILLKKPKLTLSISGSFDKSRDLFALKSKKLKQKIIEISKQEHPDIQILERLYSDLGGDIARFREELKAKTNEEISQNRYQRELYLKCVDLQNILQSELVALANKRALSIQNYLIQNNRTESQKIILNEIETLNDSDEKYIASELKIVVK